VEEGVGRELESGGMGAEWGGGKEGSRMDGVRGRRGGGGGR